LDEKIKEGKNAKSGNGQKTEKNSGGTKKVSANQQQNENKDSWLDNF
jgi:hypothetical protein